MAAMTTSNAKVPMPNESGMKCLLFAPIEVGKRQ
jgi:hypothetical protein